MFDLKFPCSQRPDSMKKSEKGFYCQGCDKSIHDFRGKNKEEIMEVLCSSTTEVCGVFDTPMIRSKMERHFSLFRMAFAAVFFLGLSSTDLMAQVGTSSEPPVEQSSEERYIHGKVTSDDGEPIPFARVWVGMGEKRIGTISDIEGDYRIKLPADFHENNLRVQSKSILYGETIVERVSLHEGQALVNIELSNELTMLSGMVIIKEPEQIVEPWDFNKTVLNGDDLRNY